MITRDEFRQIANNGVWKQNTSIVQILGLCPLLAVTTNLVNGAMLSLATIIVMAMSGLAIASLRNLIPHEIRIPVFILIVAALVTVIDLLFNANLHELYLVLGIFIPLIVTNCIVLARVEAFAAKNPPLQSMSDGIFMGVGMLWTLSLLGGLREVIGSGTLFSGIGHHLLCNGMVGFCHLAFRVMLVNAFTCRTDFRSTDRPGNRLFEYFQVLSVALPD